MIEFNNSVELIKRICNGYLSNYRRNNWHKSSNYSDMTSSELNFFSEVGTLLGFHVRREMNYQYPRDLCWCESTNGGKNDIEAQTYLYIERENEDNRAIENTVLKLLNKENSKNIPNLMAVFGWIKPKTLDSAKDYVRKYFANEEAITSTFSIISWVGENKEDSKFRIECWITNGENEFSRTADPILDENEFWYVNLRNSEWIKE